MRIRMWAALAAGLLGLSVTSAWSQGPAPQSPIGPPTLAPLDPSDATVTPGTPTTPTLERADLEAWLDGMMPFALARGDIPGAIVVVVKDGQVLLQKGYGFADVAARQPVSPDATLFRPGSVSKLFTWTAVMQLVEEGRIDLDRDVNAYLDFRIPPYNGKPVTMRQIMTHTAGFEESARYTIVGSADQMLPLGELMKRTIPERIFAPGTTPAYSNYATALAGYIIERVSGLSFDEYIERRIFQPLGMARSTFRQPLPPRLAPLMSKGYTSGSDEAQPFEFVGPAPAGSLSSTGADMARFMIAHLADGRGLMRPETARTMHNTTLTVLPPLNRMALGFYEQNVNGRRVIAHAGDTQQFHSNLTLFPGENVGEYMSVNSAGRQAAAGPLRSALFQQFADRYFPAPRQQGRVDAATARRHAEMMAGNYVLSRGFQTNFLAILGLIQQPTLGVTPDGRLLASAVTGLDQQPRNWIEIAPFVWRDADSGDRLAAQVVDGRVVRWSVEPFSPFMVFDRVPWYRNAAWLRPAFYAAIAIMLVTALAWPTRAVARRFAAPAPFEGRRMRLYRALYILAWAAVLVLAGWITFIMIAFSDFTLLEGGLDAFLWLLQILSAVVFVGLAVFAAWNAWLGWTEKRSRWSRLWSTLLLMASLVLLWVALAFHLIGFGTNY